MKKTKEKAKGKEKMLKTKKRLNKGITLIALVVTIVVLIILVGISINLVLDNNGIIAQTKKSQIESDHSSVFEAMSLEIVTYSIDKAVKNSTSDVLTFLRGEGKIDENNVVNVKNLVNQKLSTGNGTGKSDVYIIEKNDNNEYELIYYDKGQTPRTLGSLTKENEEWELAYLEMFSITEEGAVSINEYYYEEDGGGCWSTGKEWYDDWTLKEITIPSEINGIKVKIIEDGFLAYNEIIEKVYIPKCVTEIGYGAFEGCSNLTSITIPESVTSIGNGAFRECSSLTSITIPNSVTSIGNGAFNECSSLASITIPNSVTSVGLHAFEGCSSLASIIIPNSVTSIGYQTFYGCSNLTSITIPDSVTSIEGDVFYGCSSLTSINVENGNERYDSRNNCNAIIETSTNKLIIGINNTTIPDSVTSIGDWAFSGCSNLTSITIPESVTRIGYGAFRECSSLTTVNYKGTEAQWNKIFISGYYNGCLTNITPNYNYGQ